MNNLIYNNLDRPMKVRLVNFDGHEYTRPYLLEPAVGELMKGQTFGEVLETIKIATAELNRLEVFGGVKVDLVPNKKHPQDVDINITLKEKGKFQLKTETQVGNQEGNMLISGVSRNVLGHAEQLSATYSKGTLTTSAYKFQFTKPLADKFASFDIQAFKTCEDVQASSSHTELLRGASGSYRFVSRLGAHELKYQAVARELGHVPKTGSWGVRQDMGHTLKSSITHTLCRDTRDDKALPTLGYTAKISQEFAGLGGSTKFLKTIIDAQSVLVSNLYGFTLSGGFSLGYLKSFEGESSQPKICDRLFLGGPLSVRGFRLKGLGPHEGDDSIGGNSSWSAGLSLWRRVPIISNALLFHAFLNTGNLINYNVSSDDSYLESVKKTMEGLAENPRVSIGAGAIVHLQGMARIELNYCLPLEVTLNTMDIVKRGFQFGIGINFL